MGAGAHDRERLDMKSQSGLGTHAVLQRIKSGDAEAAYDLLKRLPESEQPRLDDEDADRNGGALFWACCKGYADVAALLLARGAPVNVRTCWGATPLHGAADNNRHDVVELLLSYGAAVDARTSAGDTPAHLAAYRGNDAVLRLLEQRGANLSARNNNGSDVRDETRRGRQLRQHDRRLSSRIAEEQAAAAATAAAAASFERVLCRSGGGGDDWQGPTTDLYSRGALTPLQRVPLTRRATCGGHELLDRGFSELAAPPSGEKATALFAVPEHASARSSFPTAAIIENGAVTARGDLSRSHSVPAEWDSLREYNLTSH